MTIFGLSLLLISLHALVSLNQVSSEVWVEEFNQDWRVNFKPHHALWGGGNYEFQADNTSNLNTLEVRNGKLYMRATLTDKLYKKFECRSSISCKNRDKRSFVQCPDSKLTIPDDICSTNPKKASYYEHGCTQSYYPRNVCLDSPELVNIVPPVQGARLETINGFGYGTVKMIARLPQADNVRVLFYQAPLTEHYKSWPRSGWIEGFTARGHGPRSEYRTLGGVPGTDQVASSLHWGDHYSRSKYALTLGQLNANMFGLESYNDKFLTYGITRTANFIETFVEDCPKKGGKCKKHTILYVDTKSQSFCDRGGFPPSTCPWKKGPVNAPFEQLFTIGLSISVGGTRGYFPESPYKGWTNTAKGKIEFYKNRASWYPSWKSSKSYFIVESITFTPE